MRIINEFDVSRYNLSILHVRTFWSPYLVQMGVGIRQSVADVDTDSLLSQNWPPSPPVRWRSCSETDSATTEKHGRIKTEKYARNAMEFLISVDLVKVWPPLVHVSPPRKKKESKGW